VDRPSYEEILRCALGVVSEKNDVCWGCIKLGEMGNVKMKKWTQVLAVALLLVGVSAGGTAAAAGGETATSITWGDGM
jgi:hypothetical protein